MTDLLDATDVTPVFDPEVRRGPDPQPDPTVRVRSEPLTYERHAPGRSYIRDLVLAETRGAIAARSRLKRHAIEMETRVNPSRVDGLGGYFSPPAWLESHYEKARRPIRTLANLIDAQDRLFPLPPGVQSLNIPLLTTGTQANGPADLEPVDDADFVDTSKSSTVATISGQSDVALQLLEQSPPGAHLDMAILDDLHAAYDAELNSMMYYGNAANDPGQFNGLNTVVASPNVITYTNATPVLTGMYAYLGQAFAQVGDNRSLPPTHVTMRSARWAWIASSEDQQLRPIVPPELAPPLAKDDTDGAIGSLLGIPVYLDDSISATMGAGANQDQIFFFRPAGHMLFESKPTMSVGLEVLSGTLGARLQYRCFAAFIIGHIQGITSVNGTGMVVQSGF